MQCRGMATGLMEREEDREKEKARDPSDFAVFLMAMTRYSRRVCMKMSDYTNETAFKFKRDYV